MLARWFLVAPELSRLAAQAEDMVGLQRASSPRYQDLSDALTKRYNENAQKLKVSDPFVTESHMVNIIIKAVMPDYFKGVVLTQDEIS